MEIITRDQILDGLLDCDASPEMIDMFIQIFKKFGDEYTEREFEIIMCVTLQQQKIFSKQLSENFPLSEQPKLSGGTSETGLCGVLSPDGKFYSCESQEHGLLIEVLEDLLKDDEIGYKVIYFSMPKYDEYLGIVTLPYRYWHGATEEQVKWMEENVDKMEEHQQQMYHQLKERNFMD